MQSEDKLYGYTGVPLPARAGGETEARITMAGWASLQGQPNVYTFSAFWL